MVVNPENVLAAFLDFDTRFQEVFKATPAIWSEVATLMPSKSKESRMPWLKAIPGLREWLGPRVVNNLSTNLQSIVNKKFEDTIGISREDFEDDTLGVYAPAVAELARQAALWPEDLIVAALEDTAAEAHDGVAFFSASHPIDPDGNVSGNQSNLQASKPLTAGNYDAVRTAMMKLKREDGKPMGIRPNLLIVPPALETTAKQIVEADSLVAALGANAATGAQRNVLAGTARVLVMPRLSSDTTWYLADTSRAIKPLIFQQRQAPEFTYLNNPSDANVFMMDEFLFGVRARGAAGYGPYYLISKCTA